jgi:hypothetical protein
MPKRPRRETAASPDRERRAADAPARATTGWVEQDAWEPTLAARMLKAEPRLRGVPGSASRRRS